MGPDVLTVNVVLSTTTHVWGDAGGEHSSPVTVTSNPSLHAAARSKLSSSNGMRREKLTGGGAAPLRPPPLKATFIGALTSKFW